MHLRTSRLVLTSSALFIALSLTACQAGCPGGPGKVIDPNSQVQACESSDECAVGTVCAAGTCVAGTCDPLLESSCDGSSDSAFCCKPWELCNSSSFTCERDPNATAIGCAADDPTCVPCLIDADCPASGDFCSGGRCFATASRENCTSSPQCPAGERCDRTNYLCVPDRGGCTYCSTFPELCCDEAQICNGETSFCEAVPGPECASDDECLVPGTFCDALFRCSQCEDDDDCGPGLTCDEGTGNCFSPQSLCTTDDDCTGDKRCAPALGQCVVPSCQGNSECDTREECDLGRFQCYLPPAVCEEDDEPNDTLSQASEVSNFVYSGVLCRGDQDIVSFEVEENKRYVATVDFVTNGQPGVVAAMLNSDGQTESSAVFAQIDHDVDVVGVTGDGENDRFYVRVSGASTARDQWTYNITVAEQEPGEAPNCETPPEEPNETLQEPFALGTGSPQTFSRCGNSDVDFFKIDLSPLHSLHVTLDEFSNAEGNLNLELYNAVDATSPVATTAATSDSESVTGVEGVSSYYLKVKLGSTNGSLNQQSYRLTATEVPRPVACDADIHEDDGSLENAGTISLIDQGGGVWEGDVPNAIRCNPQDVDYFRFSVPANLGVQVSADFNNNEGNMALDLFDAEGTLLSTSNTSTASTSPDEFVSFIGTTEAADYVARVRLASTTQANITGQLYSLHVETFDNAQCLASEPADDSSVANARCVGNFSVLSGNPVCSNDLDRLPEPLWVSLQDDCNAPDGTVDGCYRTCGNADLDLYRVGPLDDDQLLKATLEFDPNGGPLQLVASKIIDGVATDVGNASDGDNNGHIDFFFPGPVSAADALEHLIKVRPLGPESAHAAQKYALSIEVGLPCTDDDIDDDGSNETPATALDIQTEVSSGFDTEDSAFFLLGATRCTNDVDVYKFIALASDNIEVTLDSTSLTRGLIADIGVGQADLALPATSVGTAADVNEGAVSYLNSTLRTIYITVTTASGDGFTGPYQLRVSAD